jgi:hypothetical protein
MPSTLIQEQHLVIPTTLAATIGLEEAVMLQIMADCLKHRPTEIRDGASWVNLHINDALKLMPFWNEEQIERISRHLQNLGIIHLHPHSLMQSRQLVFAFSDGDEAHPGITDSRRTDSHSTDNHSTSGPATRASGLLRPASAAQQPARPAINLSAIAPSTFPVTAAESAPVYAPEPTPAPAAPSQPACGATTATQAHCGHTRRGAVKMYDSWQPNAELLRKLQEFNGIPADFIQPLVPEFVVYWRDRQSTTFSWEARFMKHVTREWQQAAASREEARNTATTKAEQAMHDHWQPSEDALEILLRSGIDAQFVQDAVPEFILYWRDRGDISSTWDSRFIAHIRRQWARYESSMQYDTEPHRIDSNWQPSGDVYDILHLANIDSEFAKATVAEFVVYWRDTNQVYNSWNSRFLQHVKTQWARRHHLHPSGQGHEKTIRTAAEPDRRSFVDKHTDQSWREGL